MLLVIAGSLYGLCAGGTEPGDAVKRPGGLSYGPGKRLAELADRRIDESSGLAASRTERGRFYTHNDSGDAPRLYSFDLAGRNLGHWQIAGAEAEDWEDMAAVTIAGRQYLLLADVGDNFHNRPHVTLYLVTEPTSQQPSARLVQTVRMKFEDGPHDCEAIAWDAPSHSVILIGKETGPHCQAFRLPWPAADRPQANQPAIAKQIARVQLPLVTGMDISPDGSRAVLSTYGAAYQYPRLPNDDWSQTLARPGQLIETPARKQGESICYGSDGRTLYLTSEQLPTPLLELPVLEPNPPSPSASPRVSPTQP